MSSFPLLDFIFPRQCHICGNTLAPSERHICTSCLSKLPRTSYHRRPDNLMEQRFAGLVPYERCAGHFFYTPDSDMAVIMHDLKYHHFRGLARYMGQVLARELLNSGFLSDIDVLIPVPMHFIKQGLRGYNQSEQICLGLSSESGIPISTDLRAIRSHKTQTQLSHQERLDNIQGIFRLSHPERLQGKHILLVDDVCTTGATLTAASQAITTLLPDIRLSLLTLAVTF